MLEQPELREHLGRAAHRVVEEGERRRGPVRKSGGELDGQTIAG